MLDIIQNPANEEKLKIFAEHAFKNGFKELIVLGLDKKRAEEFNKKTKQDKTSKLVSAIFLEPKQIPKVQKFQKNYQEFLTLGYRNAFEHKKIKYLIPDTEHSKDHTHYRNSGMDQITAKIAKQKNKTIIFDFSQLLKTKNKQLEMGRWLQNARILKKYTAQFEICSFAKQPEQLRLASDLKAMKRVLEQQ